MRNKAKALEHLKKAHAAVSRGDAQTARHHIGHAFSATKNAGASVPSANIGTRMGNGLLMGGSRNAAMDDTDEHEIPDVAAPTAPTPAKKPSALLATLRRFNQK